MTIFYAILTLSVVVLSSLIGFFIWRRVQADKALHEADKKGKKILEDSGKEAQSIISRAYKESQDIAAKGRMELEKEVKARRDAVVQIEKRVMDKEKYLDTRDSHINEKEEQLETEKEKIKQLKKKQETVLQSLLSTLEKAAGFSRDEAQKILLSNVERDVRQRAGSLIKEMEAQAKKIANRKAKEIVTDAIQRTAIDHVVVASTSTLTLPDEDLKGRIIGREGRNIRAFESLTGVDVILDDSSGAVVLSAFDPIRREIAKIALEKLISDGRINPARIEENVEKAKKEIQDIIREKGEQAVDELGLQFHPKIIELLGKLHYRTSYGQNVLAHAVEAAHIAAIMAQELQVNVNLAKRGALLHDIGKAIDFEQDGSHTDLGKDVCEKYGESGEVINCIMAHHEDEEPDTIEAVLVMMADAISSARPGARRESVEAYIKRLEKMEELAKSFEGVEKAYAIQAGREVRVMVKPDEVADDGVYKLALDIAKKIESEMDYPGEVKVNIIREMRASAVAR